MKPAFISKAISFNNPTETFIPAFLNNFTPLPLVLISGSKVAIITCFIPALTNNSAQEGDVSE